MGFELDTKDMERHAVELRLYMDKAKRRFSKADLPDQFEKIVKNVLAQSETQMTEQNSVKIDNVNKESANRLASFLESLVDKCSHPEQHETLQNTLRSSLHKARRKSVLNGSLQDGFMEQICYFCAGSPQQQQPGNNTAQGFSVNNIIAAMNLHHQLTPPSSIEGPSPPLGNPLNGGGVPLYQPADHQDHAMFTSSAQPSPDDGQPAQPLAQVQPLASEQLQQDKRQDEDDRAETVIDSQESNASCALEIVTDMDADEDEREGEGEGEGEANDGVGDKSNDHCGRSKRLSSSAVDAQDQVVPPSPDDNDEEGGEMNGGVEEQLNGAHEDSMHEWFEGLNDTALPVQRASTPVSSYSNNKNDLKKSNNRHDNEYIYKRFSDIRYSIVKKDLKNFNLKNPDIKSRANQSLNSTAHEGQTSFFSQHIQSSNTTVVDNDLGEGLSNEGSRNFLQTSATQPARCSLIVKSKPKRGRAKGQNSKHLSSNDNNNGNGNTRSKRSKVRA